MSKKFKYHGYRFKLSGLKPLLCSTDAIFKAYLEKGYVLDADDRKKRRVFIDNKADVLFVAHLDTVLEPSFVSCDKKHVYATGLDDRLGVYTAIALSKMGLKADILFTDLEESGETTGLYHECKDYNWIVEFDRAGTDFVTYNRDSNCFLLEMKDYWKKGHGSFSDISVLDTKACCFNLGIGYQLAHAPGSYFSVPEHNRQINTFIEFYYRYSGLKFKQTNTLAGDARERKLNPTKYYQKNNYDYNRYGEGYGWLARGDEAVYVKCDYCKASTGLQIIDEHVFCQECLDEMIELYEAFRGDLL